MRYALFYESAHDVMSKAPLHMEEHSAHFERFHEDGTLLGIGTFGDPQTEGAMAIFTTRDAAETFARNDPFVRNGLVRNWYVRDWNEVFSRPE